MTGRAEVGRLKRRLDATFERYKKLDSTVDLEVQSDFARYLCVLVAGYLEKAVAELVLEHARRCGGPTLQKYVETNTKRFTNAKSEKLKTFLGGFDSDWRNRLDVVLKDEFKDAVDSLIGLRHQIAHGGSATVTYQRINDYYARIQVVIDKIAEICIP
jgi:hypothetical protein